jgi:uncharacterized protein (TIGR03067 family)
MKAPILLAAMSLAAPLLAADPAAKGSGKIEGTWTAVSAERNGEKMPEDQVKKLKLIITADKFKADAGDEKHEADYKIDATKKPATIDVTPLDGAEKGKTILGIYALQGDELKICLARPGGNERPTEFASKADSETLLIVLKRDKP